MQAYSEKHLKMDPFLLVVIFSMIADVVTADCLDDERNKFCNVHVTDSPCALETECDVQFRINSSDQYKPFSDRDSVNDKCPDIKSMGETIQFKIKNKEETLNTEQFPGEVYPVRWGNRILFILNSTLKAYESTKDGIIEVSNVCCKGNKIGEYYFEEKNLTANYKQGLMNGGTKIKINYERVPKDETVIMEVKDELYNLTKDGQYYIVPKVESPQETNLTFVTEYVKYFIPFEYLQNPVLTSNNPNSSYFWGNRLLKFGWNDFSLIKRAELSYGDNTQMKNCSFSENIIECYSPRIESNSSRDFNLSLKLHPEGKGTPLSYSVNMNYVLNPIFTEAVMEGKTITIKGERLDDAATMDEYTIITRTENCTIKTLEPEHIRCTVSNADIKGLINITLHTNTTTLKLEKPNMELYILMAVLFLIVLALFIAIAWLYRRNQHKKMGGCYIIRDSNDGHLMSLIVQKGIPFQKPFDYFKRILWTHKPSGNIRYDTQNMSENMKFSLEQFGHLLKNKCFLLPALKALEKDRSTTQDHEFMYAYHLSLLFSSDLRYFLELCEELFINLVSQNKGSKSRNLMFSCSSITEYMILNWLGISMYSYMKDNIGDVLYFFTHDLKSFLEEMPIDEVTGNSYKYIFDKYRLKKSTPYEEIKIHAMMGEDRGIIPVFSCDSIVQLKKKCLAAFYRGMPVSEIPDVDDICVLHAEGNSPINEFKDKENEKGLTQHLTIDNHNIEEDELLRLTFAKVPLVPQASANDRYVQLGASVSRITTKSNRKFMHIQEPEESKPLTKKDVRKVKLPLTLEVKLMQLIHKFLECRNKSASQICLYNLFKKAAEKTGNEKTWIINCYFIQFCCQFIAEPNILLDINQELYTKKNLEGIKEYTIDLMTRCLKNPHLNHELNRSINDYISGFSQNPTDVQTLMSNLQSISDDIMRDVSFSKENSLYYIFKMMKSNDLRINSALMKDERASHLHLGDKFISIIEQIEINQTKKTSIPKL